jgi:hypothetical protein
MSLLFQITTPQLCMAHSFRRSLVFVVILMFWIRILEILIPPPPTFFFKIETKIFCDNITPPPSMIFLLCDPKHELLVGKCYRVGVVFWKVIYGEFNVSTERSILQNCLIYSLVNSGYEVNFWLYNRWVKRKITMMSVIH